MSSKEIVNDVISKDERFKTIKLNTKTGKIEIEGNKITTLDYDEIFSNCKEQFPNIKFTKTLIKDLVMKYARDNKYEPTFSKVGLASWYAALDLDDRGQPIKNLTNIVKFFENHPNFKGKFFYNEFMHYETYNDELIRDYDIADFRLICEKELGYESKDKIECAVQCLTHQNSFNPFKDKIDEILWDGVKRAETFFIDFLGVHDTPLNRSMTNKWWYAMMKRLYEPGCPFDNMLIIYDAKQGTGKSKIIQRLIESLGLTYGYDTSISCDNRDKDNVDKLNRTWIVGIDEMNEFLKKNPEQTKQFLAQTFDTARLSYAKRSEQYLRHCVFYGTSNLEYFLKDYTSNFERRYWLMEADGEVHNKKWWDEHLTDEYCQQVLGEIKYFYDMNPDFNYTTLDVDETEELRKVQYRHKTLNNDDLLRHKILKMLNKKYSKKQFANFDEFLNEAKNDNISIIDQASAEFFGEEQGASVCHIDKIPVKWVKMFIEEVLNRNLTTCYISALIQNQWGYKVAKYNNKTVNCYVLL